MEELDLAQIIGEHGFPVIMACGLGYFIYFIWSFINEHIDPALGEMHIALIRVIDQVRMLDQDMIRLQQKVDVVLEYRQQAKLRKEGEDKIRALQTNQELDNIANNKK
jgi:hypothetical protein